ncbi:MAG TPA: hypothetical protein PLM07_06695 [Candidatus Rifleibacterium sp.]|nr:hypothetical protein [Candidatus Rifleibacterium sp.]HPT45569.1 hypothetical protein [Candidatus Rifleibacterium sp.]
MKLSMEDYESLLQRYKTAKITAKSFPGGLEWFDQMNQAYENMDWQWLDNLCSGVNQALRDHKQKSTGNARQLPQREPTPQERLDLARRKK